MGTYLTESANSHQPLLDDQDPLCEPVLKVLTKIIGVWVNNNFPSTIEIIEVGDNDFLATKSSHNLVSIVNLFRIRLGLW